MNTHTHTHTHTHNLQMTLFQELRHFILYQSSPGWGVRWWKSEAKKTPQLRAWNALMLLVSSLLSLTLAWLPTKGRWELEDRALWIYSLPRALDGLRRPERMSFSREGMDSESLLGG
jgi:hypothetical protein